MTVYRRLLPDHPWADDDADTLPITDDQALVLESWRTRLRTAIRDAQQIDDVVDAYCHLQGACVDVEVELCHVLRQHELATRQRGVPFSPG